MTNFNPETCIELTNLNFDELRKRPCIKATLNFNGKKIDLLEKLVEEAGEGYWVCADKATSHLYKHRRDALLRFFEAKYYEDIPWEEIYSALQEQIDLNR